MNVHEFTALNERLKAKQAELFDHLTRDPNAAVTPAPERLLHILDWVRLEHYVDYCYVLLYNQQLPQSTLGSKTPLDAMQRWYASHPHLFVKRPCNLAGGDS